MSFNTESYLQAKTAQLNEVEQDNRSDWTVEQTSNAVNDAGLTAEQHYEQYGQEELSSAGISFEPDASFHADSYLEAKASQLNEVEQGDRADWTAQEAGTAIAEAGLTPESHYEQYGQDEGILKSESNNYYTSNQVHDRLNIESDLDLTIGEGNEGGIGLNFFNIENDTVHFAGDFVQATGVEATEGLADLMNVEIDVENQSNEDIAYSVEFNNSLTQEKYNEISNDGADELGEDFLQQLVDVTALDNVDVAVG